MLVFAGSLVATARFPEGMPKTLWFHDDPDAPLVAPVLAGGTTLIVLTVLALAGADPLIVIAFVTFGTKGMHFLVSWVIVLMLFQRWRDREGS